MSQNCSHRAHSSDNDLSSVLQPYPPPRATAPSPPTDPHSGMYSTSTLHPNASLGRVRKLSHEHPELAAPLATLVNRNTVCEEKQNDAKLFETPPPTSHQIRLTPLTDHSHPNQPTAGLKTVLRSLKTNGVIHVGRVELPDQRCRSVTFMSKVVSRSHAELVLTDGVWYVRDVGSSSGTFVNNERLSLSGVASPERELHTGDVVRFGVDYRGGQEAQFRSVRMRVEVDGHLQPEPTEFQTSQFAKLGAHLAGGAPAPTESCAICLDPISPSASLFVSPCCHMWHYRCIRTYLIKKYPYFDCPLCRKTYFLEDNEDDDSMVLDEAADE